MIFAQLGKPMFNGSVLLVPGTLSGVVYTPVTGSWSDVYSIVITTNETAVRTVTISDGTTTLTYFVGGGTGGANPPVLDQGTTPVRFKAGTAITVTVAAMTAATTIAVNVRGLVSKT